VLYATWTQPLWLSDKNGFRLKFSIVIFIDAQKDRKEVEEKRFFFWKEWTSYIKIFKKLGNKLKLQWGNIYVDQFVSFYQYLQLQPFASGPWWDERSSFRFDVLFNKVRENVFLDRSDVKFN